MDTSNISTTELNFAISNLEKSTRPEDKQLAEEANKLFDAIVQEIKPLLPYLIIPRDLLTPKGRDMVMTVFIPFKNPHQDPYSRHFYIDDLGRIFYERAEEFGGYTSTYGEWKDDSIKEKKFSEILEAFSTLINNAIKERETNMASVKASQKKLNQIMEIIKKS